MRTAGLVSRGVALLGLTAATCFAQTGPGGSWAFSIGSYVGALNIVAIGTDADHPAAIEAGLPRGGRERSRHRPAHAVQIVARVLAGEPVRARLDGEIDQTPVRIEVTSGTLADFAGDAGRVPFALAARAAGAQLTLDGEVTLPLGSGGKLSFAMRGERLDSLSGLARVELPAWGPWSFSAPIRMTPTGYELQGGFGGGGDPVCQLQASLQGYFVAIAGQDGLDFHRFGDNVQALSHFPARRAAEDGKSHFGQHGQVGCKA